ncbi:MAG: hypothetical protein QG616_661 [Pseudomonadota bacterium]|nr:hypothetical protein [Pseudomonadota bacterium]MDQ5942584.1 hypothetical protein [Pseudomonadota bacterium]
MNAPLAFGNPAEVAPDVLAERIDAARQAIFDVQSVLSVARNLAPPLADVRIGQPDWRGFAGVLDRHLEDIATRLDPGVLFDPQA